jgi:hypothetical protein
MAINTGKPGTPPTPIENLYGRRGAAGMMSTKYSVERHSYPRDLIDSTGQYGGNYVIFYINVQVDSKLAQPNSGVEFVEDLTPRDRGDLIAQNLTTGKLLAANAGLNFGAAAIANKAGGDNLFTSKRPAGGGGTRITGATKVAGLSTIGAGAVAANAVTASRAQRRLKTAIALHVPNQLQIRYGMQYGEQDTFALAAAAATLNQGEEIAKALNQGNGRTQAAKDSASLAAAIGANAALSKGPFKDANSAATGLAANPKKEQIFGGVDFRTFSLEYQFFPRDSIEAENVKQIIYQFKYHMHPEFKDANNFLYIYPSEFDIFYYQNGKENLNIHRHTSCVLTEMSINYTPNGTFNTFEDGMPTQINVQMTFRELALLTKDKIQDGL